MADMVEAVLNGEFKMVLPKHRADRPEWYTEEGWEKARLIALCQIIHEQDHPVVYYVGAEEGEMCALCAMWGAKVVMFEPNDKVMPNMRAIWEANKLPDNAIFFAGFAANKSTEAWGEALHNGLSSIEGEVIGNHGFKELQDAGEIPQVKIDDMVYATGIAPTVITMDVEGAEFEVLQGAEETIRNFKPVIMLSLHPEFLIKYWNKYSYEVRRWIIDLGYKEQLLDYQHEAHFLYTPDRSKRNG